MTPRIIQNLVLSGGGVKGMCICGALKRIYEVDGLHVSLQLSEILGVSVGAIIGLLLTVGYTPEELVESLLIKNFEELTDISIMYILQNYGLDSGNHIKEYIIELLAVKKIDPEISFSDLYKLTGINLRVASTNLDKNIQVIFDHNSRPELKVIDAIRMSYSIPFVFNCITYENDIYVDGALADNYPIELYESKLQNTLGIQLITDTKPSKVSSLQTYTAAIINCLRVQLDDKCESESTIHIDASDVSSIDFCIDNSEKNTLVYIGYEAATLYFDKKVHT